MNAYEDTRSGHSIFSETLQNLTRQAEICRGHIDMLEAGKDLNPTEVLADINALLDICQSVRDAIRSEDILATWSTKEELRALGSRLDQAAMKRKRYLDLAQYLAAGTISHRREKTRLERLAARDAAVAELIKICEMASPPLLPGPEVGEWLAWACSLEDGSDAKELLILKTDFPRLDDFVRQLEIEWWREGSDSAAEQVEDSLPAADAPVSNHSLNGVKNGAPASVKQDSVPEIARENTSPVAVEDSSPEVAAQETPAAVANQSTTEIAKENGRSSVLMDRISEILKESAPAVTGIASPEEQPITYSLDELLKAHEDSASSHLADPPFEPHNRQITETDSSTYSSEERDADDDSIGISFFRAGEVEKFTRYLEAAKKKKSKESRKVRALVAASNWLAPRDQNPLLHPKCGIRALTGFNSNADPEVTSPLEAERIIDSMDGLPLLTGGADLLRWALSQPVDDGFNGIAAVRRFTIKQLKEWFGELFHIELADQQFQDIQMLTSGIPLLVGEMHRLIIPAHDEPPTWLGHARWIEIKTSFGYRLPALAQELKSGPSPVRLKQREISVLKMVVLASDDSTAETMGTSLSENWRKYNRPEMSAMSTADEPAIELLQHLSLFTVRNGSRTGSIESIAPLESGDALRQFVRYL